MGKIKMKIFMYRMDLDYIVIYFRKLLYISLLVYQFIIFNYLIYTFSILYSVSHPLNL